MTVAKTFITKVMDEYGNVFPQAVVAILETDLMVNKNRKAEDINGEFVRKESIVGGTFTVMYYGSTQTQAQGYKARPLKQSDGENGFTDVFIIDLEQPQVVQILEGSLSEDDKEDNISRLELIRQFR